MKKLIAGLTLSIFSLSVFADTSATLQLTGKILDEVSIELSETSVQLGDLKDGFEGEVANTIEKSNSLGGYSVFVQTNGLLSHTSGDTIAYDLKYDSVLVTPGTAVEFEHDEQALNEGIERSIEVEIEAQNVFTKTPGDYTGSVQFTISAN